MRIAVVGGTGLIGSAVVRELEGRVGTEVVTIARSTGVDVFSHDEMARALSGVSVVIDVINTDADTLEEAASFFTASAGAVLGAETAAGVEHHVLLSIIGVDETKSYPHFAGKLAQEEVVRAGSVPFTIVRATQFFEFAEMAVGWGFDGTRSHVPPLLMQPIAVADAAIMLADVALAAPADQVVEIAGPERHDLVDVARRTAHARGRPVPLVASWDQSGAGVEMAGNLLLPHEHARIGSTTLQQWLDSLPHGRSADEQLVDAYLQALENKHLDGVLRLFSAAATVHSPLYGKVPAERFYPQLFSDTESSRLELRTVLHSDTAEGKVIAFWFDFHWVLADGEPAPFTVVDVAVLDDEGLIRDLHIIYDPTLVRPRFDAAS